MLHHVIAVLSSNNSSINMGIKSIEGKINMPMHITGVDYEADKAGPKAVMVED